MAHQSNGEAPRTIELDATASDDAGTLSEGPYTYDAYGNGPPMIAFRYSGRRLDAETGLYYYRARYYSPNLARFLQVDPIGYGDQMNSYAYMNGDPVNAVDPSGLRGRSPSAPRIRAGLAACRRAYHKHARGGSNFRERWRPYLAGQFASFAMTRSIDWHAPLA